MLTTKLISFVPVYLLQQRHVIQFEKKLRLESTTAWDSKLDSFLLSHTAIKLNYLINYSLVYQIKRCGFKPNLGHNSNQMCNMAYHKGYFIRLIEILGDNHSKNESNTTIYTQVSVL